MEFEYDVIISHSKPDNLRDGDKKGWVDNLKYFLNIFLGQLLDRDPKIITSDDITSGNLSSVAPGEIYPKAAALVTIVSEDFCDSENCHQELRSFISAAEGNAGLFYAENSRIFKVAKTNVKEAQQPATLHGLFSYDFYDFDEATQEVALLQIFNSESDRMFWLRLIDLAYDIYKLLRLFESDGKAQNIKTSSRTIFLAEVSSDQRRHRDIIKRELERHGHKVVPDKPLPKEPAALEDRMIELLSNSDMSIHILGENYGEILQNSEVSIVEEQNKIAAVYSERFETSKDSFPRVIWISPDLKLFNEKQQIFLEELKQDKNALTGAEIVQTPLEFLKTIAQNKLMQLDYEEFLKTQKKSAKKGNKSIYLVAESKFSDEVKKIQSYIESKGFGVSKIDYDEASSTIISSHRRNLADCDAALIYYGEDNQQWIKMKLIDLVKAPGFGRKKPMLAKGVLSSVKDSTVGVNVKVNDLTIIETPGSFSAESVDTFLDKIK